MNGYDPLRIIPIRSHDRRTFNFFWNFCVNIIYNNYLCLHNRNERHFAHEKGGDRIINRKFAQWIAIPLILIMVTLTGCQAVGGVDVGKAIENNATVKSAESNQTLNIKLEPASEWIDSDDDLEMIELINSLSLNITDAKLKDSKTASIEGALSIQDKKLPFHLSMDESAIVFDVDGAKKPLYISLAGNDALLGLDTAAFEKQIEELSPKLLAFMLKHLSNPTNISVNSVQETVHGESLSLSKLHVEINGEELLALVKPFLTSVAKDEEGLKSLIGDLYDVFYPVIKAVNTVEGAGDDAFAAIVPESRDAAVTAMYGMVKAGLDELLASYDEGLKQLLADTPELKTVLGKDTVLKLDLYLDSAQNIRKQSFDLKVALPASEFLPIKSATLSSVSEMWNIGGTVAVNAVDTTGGVIDVENSGITPGQFLRNFESDSVIYDLLKNEAGITSKTVMLQTDDEYSGAVDVDGITFVPVRYLSEQLDAEVKWTKGSDRIVVIDDITGNEIVMTVNSDQATVAGKPVRMAGAAFVGSDGKTYVPLQFAAESLGATVTEDETGWFWIERK